MCAFFKNSFSTLTLALICLLALGCDVYQEGYNLQVDVSECEASGASCDSPTGAGLLAIHFSTRENVIPRAAARRFDIQGLCNEGDFPENYIEWSLHHPGSNRTVHSNQRIFQGCKRGAFRFQVDITDPSIPAASPEYNQVHILTVEVIGRDINGQEHRNILAARREVSLLAFGD